MSNGIHLKRADRLFLAQYVLDNKLEPYRRLYKNGDKVGQWILEYHKTSGKKANAQGVLNQGKLWKDDEEVLVPKAHIWMLPYDWFYKEVKARKIYPLSTSVLDPLLREYLTDYQQSTDLFQQQAVVALQETKATS